MLSTRNCKASFTEHATNYTKPIISEKYSLFIDDLIEDVDQPAKGIIRGICNGDKSGISKSTKTLITSAGLAHVLAFIRFHVGLVSCIPFLLLRSRRVELTYLSIGGLVVVWAFIASCGFPNSAIRAGIMIIVGCLSVILGRSVLPVNSLCLATWIIFFILPNSITQIGTQLSIIATLGILAIVSDTRLLIFRIPIAAQSTTSPIISSVFNELHFLFASKCCCFDHNPFHSSTIILIVILQQLACDCRIPEYQLSTGAAINQKPC